MDHHHVEKKYWLQLVVERPLIWGPRKKRICHQFAVDLSAIARDRHLIMIGADKIVAMWATLCAPPSDGDGDGDGDGDDDDDGGELVILVGRPSTILCAPLGWKLK